MNNKKQDWRTADKSSRTEAGSDEARTEKNVAGKKPLNDLPHTNTSRTAENAPGTRAGQRSTESRNSGGSSRR